MPPANAHAVNQPRSRSARLRRHVSVALGVALTAVAASVPTSAAAATDGLVGAWNFDEASGTSVKDLSGKNNNGTATNVTRVAGKYGRAVNFTGAKTSYVTVADSTSLRLTKALTISAWVRPTSLGGEWRTVVLKEQTSQLAYGLYAANESGLPSAHVFTTRNSGLAGKSQLPLNTWTHLATTWDGNTARLYVNGTQVSTAALKGTAANSTKPLRFGGNTVWTEWFKGGVDDVRIYNRALAANEINTDKATPITNAITQIPTPSPTPSPTPAPEPVATPTPAPDTSAPSVPTGMAWSDTTTTSIGVRWNASTDNRGVAGYRIYRNGVAVGTTTNLSYSVTGLACGTSYEIGLTAFDAAGNESYRAEATGTTSTAACAPTPTPTPTPTVAPDTSAPSVPTGMAWGTATTTSIGVNWNASTDNRGVAGYRIYRNGVAAGTTTNLSYSVTGLTCGTSYEIGLTAFDAAGNESYRAEATGTTSTAACAPTPTPTATPTSTPTATPTATPTVAPTVTPTPTPPAGSAQRFVVPGGSDSGTCSSAAPCGSFQRAYNVAVAGDVIQVGSGVFSSQTLNGSGNKAVTFRGVTGNKVRAIDNYANNITFENLDLDGNFAQNAIFENHGAANVTFKNGSIGNVTDEKGALVSGENLTFDNVLFHDAVFRTPGTHMECVYAIGVPGMTVRNSYFRDCAIMDLAFTYGDWWTPLPPQYGNVTIENNVFMHSEMENNQGWHYYSVNIGSVGNGGGQLVGWTVRNNTFENSVNVYPKSATNSRWVGNVGSWPCVSGLNYSKNVGSKCGTTDKQVSPASSTASTPAAQGWINPAAGDFRLSANAPAVDAGDPADHPAADRDGKARTGLPDAGAYER